MHITGWGCREVASFRGVTFKPYNTNFFSAYWNLNHQVIFSSLSKWGSFFHDISDHSRGVCSSIHTCDASNHLRENSSDVLDSFLSSFNNLRTRWAQNSSFSLISSQYHFQSQTILKCFIFFKKVLQLDWQHLPMFNMLGMSHFTV